MKELEVFKNELKNYLKYKESYSKKVKSINDEIDLLYHSLSGLVGKGFGESSGSTNQSIKEEKRLNTLDKIERLNKKKQYYKQQIESIEDVLNKTIFKDILIRVYCKGETYEKIGREVGYSARGLQKRIDKDLMLILNEK